MSRWTAERVLAFLGRPEGKGGSGWSVPWPLSTEVEESSSPPSLGLPESLLAPEPLATACPFEAVLCVWVAVGLFALLLLPFLQMCCQRVETSFRRIGLMR